MHPKNIPFKFDVGTKYYMLPGYSAEKTKETLAAHGLEEQKDSRG
jgi:hypothetical protein